MKNSMAMQKQHRILIATDGSRTAEAGLATALKFPWPASSCMCAIVARSRWLPDAIGAHSRGCRDELRDCCGRGPQRIGAVLARI